jgi:hypothetical protein
MVRTAFGEDVVKDLEKLLKFLLFLHVCTCKSCNVETNVNYASVRG